MPQCFRLSLIVVITCVIQQARAQQGNNWYFGEQAGMSFNTNPPTVLFDGALATYEGCASISDNNGQLLFYTNGVTVWNRLHQIMPNGTGLKGHQSSTNSAIVIPKPGSSTIFYIFTSGAVEANNEGYFYSEVDMTRQGGLGDITAAKNVLLYAPSTEKLTAARHSNGVDVWVITKCLNNTEWRVFKVDCNGVNVTPVLSIAGNQPNPFFNNENVGCLKISPDGKKLAAVNTGPANWELFKFDASSGLISDALFFRAPPRPYGVEFSPNSQLVYVGNEWLPPNFVTGGIDQYSIDVYDSAAIASSKISIGAATDWVGALQMGPDNKIYFTVEFQPNLGVINSPDTHGVGCNFSALQVDLLDRLPLRGLPVFFPSLIINKNADFNYVINTDCATVNFSGTTSIAGSVTWQWDFGDGHSDTGQNVVHTYLAGGPATDTVRLTVTSTSFCGSAVAVKTIVVNPGGATANFYFEKQCALTQFFDSTVTSGAPVISWSWNFGDGNFSNLQNPTHLFPASGVYTVTLTTETATGCNRFSTKEKTITVAEKPIANFISNGSCANSEIDFTDQSALTSGNISSWSWQFGDGTSSSLKDPKKIYAAPGMYQVTLVVGSDQQCFSDTVIKNVVVFARPIAGISSSNGCVNNTISIFDSSTLSGDSISGWYWDLGNGTISLQQNPVANFALPGSYTIRHVVQSSSGCVSDTVETVVSIETIPLANFSADNGCENQPLPFSDLSSITSGTITNWNWSFGDGVASSIQNPSHNYTAAGNFTVMLSVRSANGCISDTVTKTISIDGIPAVAFSNTDGCINDLIQFTNQSTISSGNIVRFEWDFGDGSTSQLLNPAHSYPLPGDYVVTLKAVTTNGCEATASRTLSIQPVHAFAGNDTIVAIGQPFQLHASGGKYYLWDPPDFLSSDTIFNPVVMLDHDQRYVVQVRSEQGCISVDDIFIQVIKGPEIYVPSAFAPNGKNKIFRPVLVGIKDLYYFSVYNRWGQLVFTTREPGKGWNGTFNGVDQSTGVFVWIVKAKDYQGHIIEKKGTVVLVR